MELFPRGRKVTGDATASKAGKTGKAGGGKVTAKARDGLKRPAAFPAVAGDDGLFGGTHKKRSTPLAPGKRIKSDANSSSLGEAISAAGKHSRFISHIFFLFLLLLHGIIFD